MPFSIVRSKTFQGNSEKR